MSKDVNVPLKGVNRIDRIKSVNDLIRDAGDKAEMTQIRYLPRLREIFGKLRVRRGLAENWGSSPMIKLTWDHGTFQCFSIQFGSIHHPLPSTSCRERGRPVGLTFTVIDTSRGQKTVTR